MILRQTTTTSTYQVVGEAFVYGLHDAIGLLGPLPAPWTVQVCHKSRSSTSGFQFLYRFLHMEAGDLSEEDPRLEPLPPVWERLDVDRTSDDPEVYEKFRNTDTGEEINFDPRMRLDALEARGIPLRTFALS